MKDTKKRRKRGGGTAYNGKNRVLRHYRQIVACKVKCRWYGMQLGSRTTEH